MPFILEVDPRSDRQAKLGMALGFAKEGDDTFVIIINGILGIYTRSKSDLIDYESVDKDIIDICEIGYRACIEKKLAEARHLLKGENKKYKYDLIYREVRKWEAEADKFDIKIGNVEKAIRDIESERKMKIEKRTKEEAKKMIEEVRDFFSEP